MKNPEKIIRRIFCILLILAGAALSVILIYTYIIRMESWRPYIFINGDSLKDGANIALAVIAIIDLLAGIIGLSKRKEFTPLSSIVIAGILVIINYIPHAMHIFGHYNNPPFGHYEFGWTAFLFLFVMETSLFYLSYVISLKIKGNLKMDYTIKNPYRKTMIIASVFTMASGFFLITTCILESAYDIFLTGVGVIGISRWYLPIFTGLAEVIIGGIALRKSIYYGSFIFFIITSIVLCILYALPFIYFRLPTIAIASIIGIICAFWFVIDSIILKMKVQTPAITVKNIR